MADQNNVYTYRNGKKVALYKKADQFVARMSPENIATLGVQQLEQVSPSAFRATVPADQLDSVMSASRTLAPTHHAYQLQDTNQEFLITDRIMVTFKKKPDTDELSAFINKYALIIKAQYSDIDFLFQLTNQSGMNPVKMIVKINEEEPGIAIAEHDLIQRVTKYLDLPADPSYNLEWHLHTRTAPAEDYDPRSSSRCEEAWLLLNSYGSADVVIGLADDGCKLDHDDFDSTGKFAGWGYFNRDTLVKKTDIGADPSRMYQPDNNHGTSCAGVIAGEVDGTLTVGAAPGCRLLPVKWESSPEGGLFIDDNKMMLVLQYISDKVDVFSNSWGSSPTMMFSQQVVNRIQSLAATGGRRGKGIVFLWASGNENCPIEYSGDQEIPFDHGVQVSGDSLVWVGVQTSKVFTHNLVGIPGVMHIAALASTARRSHYSNYGPGISLTAPTNNVHTYYRLAVEGKGIVTTTGDSIVAVTDSFGGTSSATPLTAGIAGLVISANPDLTALEVISVLQQTASKDLNTTPYPQTPPANFDNDTSWDVSPVFPANFEDQGLADGTWSNWFGFGKADACEAVRKALELRVGAPAAVVVKIRSAIVNPAGSDRNAEKVILENGGDQPVSIEGWAIVDKNNRTQLLTGSIPPVSSLTVDLETSQIILNNTGGTISLRDRTGNMVHQVSYTGSQAAQGNEVVFAV
ncbi:S8 family serine peptidase [Dyadobacter sandarakinus]|uniref:S8 family serine peptidase n=1 Tax=Dyadobacter sandarakinus TaxID=2747268 RepID=A0ABX7I1A5_9BACT|nr:S8 family serine peptidase [Dyadobacter sandarakinus]QRQ99544.1 S8 family serine peptidase [Dyadobacter sandarakinus]